MNPGVLKSVRRRLGAWLLLRLVLLVAGVVGAGALGAVLLDVALDLPDQTRMAAPWLLGGCVVLLLAWGVWKWFGYEEERVALLLERAQPSLGNRLVNAVQLGRRTGNTGVEECLRLEAVELGRQAAAKALVWPVVKRGLHWGTAVAGAALAGWICLAGAGGGLLQAVIPRFLDPAGDHPPYSKMRIAVSPGGARVLYGGQVEVRATVSGRPADKLWLVARSGTNVLRAIMFLAPDKTFFQSLVNLREPAEYFVTDGRARSYRFPIGIRYTPQIALVELTTTFPDYTGKPPRTAKLSEEPQAFPEGTKVNFRVASNRPLKQGQLTLTPVLGGKVTQLLLRPEDQNNIVAGGFTLTEPVVFSIGVRDVTDLDSVDPRQGRFNLLPDERPRLFVLEPGRDAVATPSIKVPVRVEATDDYGITRVAWLRGLNRSIERPFNMKLALKNGAQAVEAAGAFDFAQLGVRPGDIIEYYFEAADNDPKGPNLALSRSTAFKSSRRNNTKRCCGRPRRARRCSSRIFSWMPGCGGWPNGRGGWPGRLKTLRQPSSRRFPKRPRPWRRTSPSMSVNWANSCRSRCFSMSSRPSATPSLGSTPGRARLARSSRPASAPASSTRSGWPRPPTT